MQKAPVMKGSGLTPLEANKPDEEIHVFGKNLEERVVTKEEEESTSLTFNSIQSDQKQDEDDIEAIRKRKFDAITGEEDEETIFQGDFKLFIWDLSTSNWIEKGRGQLKLNDSNEGERKSRLIMRVGGTLRIILNVAIKRSFFRILANSKTNIRFTDSQTVWAASGSNAHQLKDLLDERLKMTPEEENELKKRTISDVEDSCRAKKTKADPKTSSPSSSNEDKETSPQKGTNEGETKQNTNSESSVNDDSQEKEGETKTSNGSDSQKEDSAESQEEEAPKSPEAEREDADKSKIDKDEDSSNSETGER